MTSDRDESRPQATPVSSDPRVVAAPAVRRGGGAEARVYIKADMEGVSGVVSSEQLRPGSAECEAARRMLMHDLNAVLDGAFGAGCTEAVIYDTHGAGRNLDVDALDRRAVAICGKPPPTDGFYYGLDESFDALFLVGAHARAGAPNALLPHTYEDDIVSLKINDTEVGEIGLEAALAGKFGVPLAFLSGDSGAVRETQELLGSDVETVEVKVAVTADSGICLSAARTGKLLAEGAQRAVRRAHLTPPVVFQSPTTLEVVFRTPDSAAALEGLPGVERTGERTVRTQGATVLAAYRDFVLARARNGTV